MESPVVATFYEMMQQAGYDPLKIRWEDLLTTPPPPPPPR